MAYPHRPAFQFYNGDWFKDPRVRMCKPATRGIWFDLICAMEELADEGSITGTILELARICAATPEEVRSAIDELNEKKTADVTERNGKITLVCRRIQREARTAQDNANRQHRWRERKRTTEQATPVTPVLRENNAPSSSSTSVYTAAASAAAASAREERSPQAVQPAAQGQAAAAAAGASRFAQNFPKTERLVREAFPGTDSELVRQIVERARQVKPDADDGEISDAVLATHKGKLQRSAALWRETVPAYLETRCRGQPAGLVNGTGPPDRAGEVCPECGGTGEIFNPECEQVPNSVWLDWPPERQFLPCPRCRGAPRKPPRQAENPSALLEAKHG